MILQKIRGFFEWLGKRSMAKSRKALNYEWTTMRPEGEAPVKTVNIDEPEASVRPAPVKTVEVESVKPATAAPVAATQSAAVDAEKQMVAVLKVLTIRDAVEALQAKFENAADVRRSRVALLAYLKDSPEAVAFLQEKVKEKKKATKKPAKKTPVKKPAPESVQEASSVQADVAEEKKPVNAIRKPAVKGAAPKKVAVTEPGTPVETTAVEPPVEAASKGEESKPIVKKTVRKTAVKRTAAKKTATPTEEKQEALVKKTVAKKTTTRMPTAKRSTARKVAPKVTDEVKPAEQSAEAAPVADKAS